MINKEVVLTFGAHSDDLEIGMGATIAKYNQQGKYVVGIMFSRGDKSSPWLKEDYLINVRKEEADKIGKFIGCKETLILGLSDGKLQEEIENKKFKGLLRNLIKKYKPTSIYVHSKRDPHPDHRSVNRAVFEALDDVDPKKDINVYVYEVWNVLNETRPRIYVDVTDTFHIKLEAMKKFKSQKLYVYLLMVPVIVRAIFSGFHAGCKLAERFYKIR
ncbi:PIG-L family deacetylase [Candidatus Woesearchaeota archaeon]|nr:PIG-L family deacetylase [Candidatus Woesearchaeota archaeon]